MPAPENGEKLLEMELLRGPGQVNDFIRMPGFQAIRKGGQISRGVVKRTIPFLDQGGVRFPYNILMIPKQRQRYKSFAIMVTL